MSGCSFSLRMHITVGMISLNESSVGMYGKRVLQDAVCDSSSSSVSQFRTAVAAMEMLLV